MLVKGGPGMKIILSTIVFIMWIPYIWTLKNILLEQGHGIINGVCFKISCIASHNHFRFIVTSHRKRAYIAKSLLLICWGQVTPYDIIELANTGLDKPGPEPKLTHWPLGDFNSILGR